MRKWPALAAVLTVIMPLGLMLLAGAAAPASTATIPATAGAPSRLAAVSIPPLYLSLYLAAASTCPGLPWQVLAGIGEVETNHGQLAAPGVRSGANFAGAEGPMQFLPATFARYATGPDRPLSPYDPADAVYTTARMLCASGAAGGSSQGIRNAIFAYNHATWYVSEVLAWAARYVSPAGSASVAAPEQAAADAIKYAESKLGDPYVWGADGPDAFDCSGLVYQAYLHAGIRIGRTTYQWRQDGPVVPLDRLQPGDLLFSAGADGTPDNPGHVVMYLGGGRIIQAPHTGAPVQEDPLSLAGVVVATRPAQIP